MMKVPRASGHRVLHLWNRIRVQAGGVLVFAVVLPTLILAAFYDQFLFARTTHFSAMGNALAAVSSVYLIRNISLHPGIRGAFFTFPSVMACFALTFSLFLLLRIDYSRALLLSGGIGALVWLYFVQLMVERGPALCVAAVPGGNVDKLEEIPTLEVIWLNEPAPRRDFDLLVADFHADLSDEWEAYLADCALASVPVLHVKQLCESLTGRVEIEHLSENSFGSLIPFKGYLRLRRIIDFATAIVALALLVPLFVVIGAMIRMDSRGPVLFRQVRIGYRGKPFRVLKFRTMRPASDVPDARAYAMTHDDDPRITRFGRFLRRSRIDELPQIFNIVRGDMSWIGPRPEAEALSRWYEAELPFYRYRHIVPPGITGWAQVTQGHVFELDQVMNKLQYDFYYIKNFSPWLDALIVAKTVRTVLTGFGSR